MKGQSRGDDEDLKDEDPVRMESTPVGRTCKPRFGPDFTPQPDLNPEERAHVPVILSNLVFGTVDNYQSHNCY